MIYLIAAISENNVIGDNNKLPWHIPEDLKHFKEITNNSAVLMGRKTYESIVSMLGKPLPNRTNIVITRQKKYKVPEGVEVYTSLEQAISAHGDKDIFVIGGGQVYRHTIDNADKLYITHVHKKVEGDTHFPEIDKKIWQETRREDKDGYSFVEYEKIS